MKCEHYHSKDAGKGKEGAGINWLTEVNECVIPKMSMRREL